MNKNLYNLNYTGVRISFVISIFFIILMFFNSPVELYHKDVTNYGMDLGVFYYYQLLIISIFLRGYKKINNLVIIISPILSYFTYYFEFGNVLARFLHKIFDGEWTGIDSQNVLFDKQQIFVTLTFVSIFILMSYYFNKKKRSFDRTIGFFLLTSTLLITILYHLIAYFRIYSPYANFAKSGEKQLEKNITEKFMKNKVKGCIEGYGITCVEFTKKERFPERDVFRGNKGIYDAKNYYEENLYNNLKRSKTNSTLYYSSVDDAYMEMYVGLGIFLNNNYKNLVFYNRIMDPYIILMGNSVRIIIFMYIFIWTYIWLIISILHRKKEFRKKL